MKAVPFVSVIVATRNRAGLLAQTLDALAGQRWPRDRFEVIVADNASTDETAAVVAERAGRAQSPPIRYLYAEEPGKSAAVNRALEKSRGDLLAFTDDDVLPEPDWIARLAAVFDDTGIDFAAGRILPRWEAPPPPWMSPSLYGVLAIPDNGEQRIPIRDAAADVIPIGANMAVRRTVVTRIGGLRADFGKLEGTLRTGEDHEFFLRMLRAGCVGAYEPSAAVRHFVPTERLDRAYVRRWLYQNGQDVARLDRAYAASLRRWLGVPRYLWKQAVLDLFSTVRAALARDPRRRLAGSARIGWFIGYVREVWFRRRSARGGSMRLAEGR